MFGAVAAAAAGSVAACEAEEEGPELASMAIFSGNANPDLAALIAEHVGKPLGSATVGRFPDGEVSVSVHENGENGPRGRPGLRLRLSWRGVSACCGPRCSLRLDGPTLRRSASSPRVASEAANLCPPFARLPPFGPAVRGKDIYIIQPTCPPHVNEYLVELLLVSCVGTGVVSPPSSNAAACSPGRLRRP